ncbi:ROK family transcriptional regulator [Streptomyces sp. HNM0645]|uniref:ROK family transcriptional regulator n=1 Tax=Streptomyces sp. HNM0645 TaxID=2782343 RepID=UPI0024B6D610|nr:ROK family transcriptional regulator [Streptomyces sp. HNM0645]MDI9884485.1 ROK family transcriptional regulator [Streptomyces sp. HNM0645]
MSQSAAGAAARGPGRAPADQMAVRRANLVRVLGEVRSAGPLSRAAVARHTGLTRATVSSLVAELIERGLLRETDFQQDGSVGRPGRRLEIDGRAVAALGLEVNSRYLAAWSTDLAGGTRQERRLVHDATREGPERTIRALAGIAAELLDEARAAGAHTAGVGVAVPGPVDAADGSVRAAPNLGWRDVPVARLLRDLLGLPAEVPVVVDNEANLAALAERGRAGSRAADLVYVTGEAGIGAGIVADGGLLRGAGGFSGELGHLQVDPAGERCACGRTGCLETKVGLTAAIRTAAPDLAADGPGGAGALDPKELAAELLRRATEGDPRALGGLDEIGRWLGIGLAIPVNLLNPEVIVLGGYFATVAPYLLPAAMRELRERAVAGDPAVARVTGSALGFTAAVRGAAGVVVEEVFADPARLMPPAAGAAVPGPQG